MSWIITIPRMTLSLVVQWRAGLVILTWSLGTYLKMKVI